MKIYIKYMVSIRCKMVVESELKNLGIDFLSVEIGSVLLSDTVTPEKVSLLKKALMNCGLGLLEDKKSIIIEKIKSIIINFVYSDEEPLKINFSKYLADKLGYDYTYLSNMFSEITAVNIESYIIALKMERAKELLVYGDYTLSEISIKLHYSSLAHLSGQFKKHTGLTPSSFKSIRQLKKAQTSKKHE